MEFWERYAIALLVVALMLGGLSLLIAPQASIHVVRIGSRCMLLGAGRERVTALGDVPDEGGSSR